MQTPKNPAGYKTDKVMMAINNDFFDSKMSAGDYNKMYNIVYRTLRDIGAKNIMEFLKSDELRNA